MIRISMNKVSVNTAVSLTKSSFTINGKLIEGKENPRVSFAYDDEEKILYFHFDDNVHGYKLYYRKPNRWFMAQMGMVTNQIRLELNENKRYMMADLLVDQKVENFSDNCFGVKVDG